MQPLDSVEVLLLRHYGEQAPTPSDLESRLRAGVTREAASLESGQRIARLLGERRLSRRRAAALVALGAAGAGMLSLGLDCVQSLLTPHQRELSSYPAYSG
ncbi:hypothetical protein [Thermogemmatispora carboxidivorans]|uniref:hypothetical protein n=1 Tax=Thermogemmatispora carboxidivorans TaxID=1382306 RepID=UPI00069BC912|nr:hypothetical protein [Thermogemmatispora carboxidivorans]